MVICLERGADLHMAQLMPLPLTVSCFSNIQVGFPFLVPAHLGSPGKGPFNGCVCILYSALHSQCRHLTYYQTATTHPSSTVISLSLGHLARMDENADATFEPPAENWR